MGRAANKRPPPKKPGPGRKAGQTSRPKARSTFYRKSAKPVVLKAITKVKESMKAMIPTADSALLEKKIEFVSDAGLHTKNHNRQMTKAVPVALQALSDRLGPMAQKEAVTQIYQAQQRKEEEARLEEEISDEGEEEQDMAARTKAKIADAIYDIVNATEKVHLSKKECIAKYVQSFSAKALAGYVEGHPAAEDIKRKGQKELKDDMERHWTAGMALYLKLQNLLSRAHYTNLQQAMAGSRNGNREFVHAESALGVPFPKMVSWYALSKHQQDLVNDLGMVVTFEGDSVRVDLEKCMRADILQRLQDGLAKIVGNRIVSIDGENLINYRAVQG